MIKIIEFEQTLGGLWLGTFKRYLTGHMKEIDEIQGMYDGRAFENVTDDIKALGSVGVNRLYVSLNSAGAVVVGAVDEMDEFRK